MYCLFLESQEQLMDIYERLDDLSADTAEARAGYLLYGLGFTKEMQNKKTKDFSGKNLTLYIYLMIVVYFDCNFFFHLILVII